MTIQHWLTFMVATFLICGSPGPNMLHMMTTGAAQGFRRTFFSMAGCFIAVMILIGGSVAGVATILSTSPTLFGVLRLAGAAYLVYLGFQAWRAPVTDASDPYAPSEKSVASGRTLFRKGFMVGISNPKALFFASAFFPQFITQNEPELPQLVILLATFVVIEVSWYATYALGGERLAVIMRGRQIRRIFNRLTGSVFVLFGAALAVQSA